VIRYLSKTFIIMKRATHFSSALVYGALCISFSSVVSAVPEDLVETLGNENYQKREDAERKLSAWAKGKGKKTFHDLEVVKEKARSPEVKMRLDNVLSSMTIYEPIPNTRGFIGIGMEPQMGGAFITRVQPDTPAEKHGLLVGDVIVEIDGIDLTKKRQQVDEAMNFLRSYVKTKNSGSKLTMKLLRNDKELLKELKLADYAKAQLNGIPLNQLQGFQFAPENGDVIPRPNAQNNLQFKMQLQGNNLNLQLDAQQLMKEMLEQQLQAQPDLKGFDNQKMAESLKKLMLENQQKQLEQMKKQMEGLKEQLPQKLKKPAEQ